MNLQEESHDSDQWWRLLDGGNSMLEMVNTTNVLLENIADRKFKRLDIARLYALSLESSEKTDYKVVNAAIIERWSKSALIYIKEMAWSGKCFENK